MIKREIGAYQSFILEAEDMVVVMGNLEAYVAFLEAAGFERHPETREFVGKGEYLYALEPEAFFDCFSAKNGPSAELIAQATDGESFYQIDGLPLVEEDVSGKARIARITALDMETKTFIEEGVGNFRVG